MLTATLYWVGGTSGAWNSDSTNLVWSQNPSGGPTNQGWTAGAQAVFGGAAAAAITVDSGITADSIQFNTDGYLLSGGSITLSGTDTINVAPGLTDTISSPLTVGSSFAQTGGGSLIAGNLTTSGSVQVSAGNNLSSTQLTAGSLVINGTAGNPGSVTIAPTQNGTPPTILYWHGGSSGNWNSANQYWSASSAGGPNVGWTSGAVAIFAGTGGSVSVDSGISAAQIIFVTTGYTLSGGPLTAPQISVSKGAQATISSVLTGTNGLDVTGGGTLLVSGSNTYTGATFLTASTLMLGSSTALGGSTNVSASPVRPGVIDLNGQNIGSTAAFDLFPGSIINSSSTPAICAARVNDQLNFSNSRAS